MASQEDELSPEMSQGSIPKTLNNCHRIMLNADAFVSRCERCQKSNSNIPVMEEKTIEAF
jgi:hypothetical protein